VVRWTLAAVAVAALGTQTPPPVPGKPEPQERGILLDDLGGNALKDALARHPVVVIPIGRTTEPHPAHLTLNADWRLMDQIRRRLAEIPAVAVAAPVTHVPTTWKTSTPASAEFFADITRTLSQHGARRFLVVDVFRTVGAAATAAVDAASADGLLLAFEAAIDAHGRHGDPDEALLLLHFDRSAIVDSNAIRPDPARSRLLADQAIQRMSDAVARLQAAVLPKKRAPAPPSVTGAGMTTRRVGTEGDYRSIVSMAATFSQAWTQQQPGVIAGLFADDGDMRHPDGLVERGRSIIHANRIVIFADRKYASSKHPLRIATITFRGPDVAIADGKWELVGVRDQPDRQGPFTWVLIRTDGGWKIAAWRYALTP
jgi:uncharacterized protein (TIGR02246 family)